MRHATRSGPTAALLCRRRAEPPRPGWTTILTHETVDARRRRRRMSTCAAQQVQLLPSQAPIILFGCSLIVPHANWSVQLMEAWARVWLHRPCNRRTTSRRRTVTSVTLTTVDPGRHSANRRCISDFRNTASIRPYPTNSRCVAMQCVFELKCTSIVVDAQSTGGAAHVNGTPSS